MNLRNEWLEWKYMAKYRNPIYKEYLYWKDRIWAWWKARHLRRAKKLAIARHKTDGKTYYVLPDDRGIPRSFSAHEIDILKRNGLMHRKVNCYHLYQEAMFIANQKTAKSK
jgi:hypothetical protein